jgi:thymidylate kinase
VLITFSGLDGAGKSTLIAWLQTALQKQGHAVAVLHLNDDVGVYAYLRVFRNWLLRLRGRAPARATARKTGPVVPRAGAARRLRNALVWSATLRCVVYPIDLLIFTLYRFYIEKITHRVLLTDRYFYDTLVDLSKGGSRAVHRLLQLLTPTPDVPVLLDVPPEHAFARKGEYSLPYLERRWIAYQAVFSRVPARVVVRNANAWLAQAKLWRAVTEHPGQAGLAPARLERAGEPEP